MIGIVIIAHGELSSCFINTLNLFIKDVEGVTFVNLTEDIGPERFELELKNAISMVEQDKGVLIMADMFGGTPSNVAWKLLSSLTNIECITGVNLPMILEVIAWRKEVDSVVDLANIAKDAGTNSVRVLEHI